MTYKGIEDLAIAPSPNGLLTVFLLLDFGFLLLSSFTNNLRCLRTDCHCLRSVHMYYNGANGEQPRWANFLISQSSASSAFMLWKTGRIEWLNNGFCRHAYEFAECVTRVSLWCSLPPLDQCCVVLILSRRHKLSCIFAASALLYSSSALFQPVSTQGWTINGNIMQLLAKCTIKIAWAAKGSNVYMQAKCIMKYCCNLCCRDALAGLHIVLSRCEKTSLFGTE